MFSMLGSRVDLRGMDVHCSPVIIFTLTLAVVISENVNYVYHKLMFTLAFTYYKIKSISILLLLLIN